MPKLTYVLTSTAVGKHLVPLAVSGRYGLPFGHAPYDPAVGAHVARFTQEQYENGMDEAIAKSAHLPMCQWIIRAEVQPDLESPEGKLEQALDAARAEIAGLQAQVEEARRCVEEMKATTPMQTGEDILPGSAPKEIVPAPNEELAAAQKADEISARLAPFGMKELEEEFEKANTAGAGLVIEDPRSKVKLRAALTEYYLK